MPFAHENKQKPLDVTVNSSKKKREPQPMTRGSWILLGILLTATASLVLPLIIRLWMWALG